MGNWETRKWGNLGDGEISFLRFLDSGILGKWWNGKLGNWETWILGNWETGKLGNWEIGEWGFKEIVADLHFVDYQKKMQIYKVPIGKIWPVVTLLANAKCCFRGNQVSAYFNNPPRPDIATYLNWIDDLGK